MPANERSETTGRLADDLRVDPASSVPPFEQVRAQLAERIADGDLVVGTRLPSVRALADQLGLAVNTVARSYRELEAAHLVETHGRGGTIVTAAGDRSRARLKDAAATFAAVARDSGIGSDEALAAVRAALAAATLR